MAGIGFALRKLSQEKTFTATFRAYIYAALAASGPWILTILTIGGLTVLTQRVGQKEALYEFRILLVYNFSFSLVLASPLFIITTRYLADRLYLKDLKSAPGLIVGSLMALYIFLLPFALIFYGMIAHLTLSARFNVIVNLMLISTLWLVSLFVSIIQDFRKVSWAYLIGGTIALIMAWGLLKILGEPGLMAGFNAGLAVTLGVLIAQIFTEYNYEFKFPTLFLSYVKRYRWLVLSAFMYNAGAWCDKWIMWFSSHSQHDPSGLRYFDNYDSAMFLSQLTIIPGMALFLLTVETGFFERCRTFYGDILNKVTYAQIEKNHKNLLENLLKSARDTFILQGGITALIIAIAPYFFMFFNFQYLQIGIFRLGTLGSCFQMIALFILMLMTYFDARREPVIISFVFLISNALFTSIFMRFGYQFYGYGYFLSALLTFCIATILLVRLVRNLPYQAFIRNNQSIQEI